jgi:hypothetical protein
MQAADAQRAEAPAAAGAVVGELFPTARWAILAGGVLTAARTPGSDLDIVVCLPEDPGLPFRWSLRRDGWPVELFVHDRLSLEHYLARNRAERRPALHRMLATGHIVAGDADEAARARNRCALVLADGPDPLPEDERRRLRYGLTDLLDDLAHGHDPAETVAITATLWRATAELALSSARHWLGTGKWLLRELRDLDAGLAARWVAAHGDPARTAALAAAVLDRAGGALFDGYRAAGVRPTRPVDS